MKFSPPDISEREIELVTETLRSGWITTGPRTTVFEKLLSEYCQSSQALAVSSATAGLELILYYLGIGEGDEVITTPYTFTATAAAVLHTGAKPVFADILPGTFIIDPEEIQKKMTDKTKAVIPVDFGGMPADYDTIRSVLDKSGMEENPALIADAAHSIGAVYKEKPSGSLADFSVFSFHAVKNLCTAEGGAVLFDDFRGNSGERIYRDMKRLSLHGQSRDAEEKWKKGGWRYGIMEAGYKFNMTDITASIGIGQLERYPEELLPKRKKICRQYHHYFKNYSQIILPELESSWGGESSCHLYPLRIDGFSEEKRDEMIRRLEENEIAVNVHYIPLPLHPAYLKLGYRIENFPNAYQAYSNEISLPVHTLMDETDVETVAEGVVEVLKEMNS